MSNAGPTSACDPQKVAAALAIRQARLTEETLNASIKQDSLANKIAEYWTVRDFQLFKFYSGRLAFLAAKN